MEFEGVSFAQALAQQPAWVRWWVNWINLASIATALALVALPGARKAGAILIVAMVATVLGVGWLYSQVGYTRLLGLPHLVIWIPLLAYLIWRVRRPPMHRIARYAVIVLCATLVVSLAFDVADVARYLMGETEVMVSGTAG